MFNSKNLTKLPDDLPKRVAGDFDCANNQLISLKGSPEIVGGYFNCIRNQLVTLEGGPKRVEGNFDCGINKLKTLEGAPEKVGGYFNCSNNNLVTLEGGPKEVKEFFCVGNPLPLIEIIKFVSETNIKIRIYTDYNDEFDFIEFKELDKREKIKYIFKRNK